MPRHLLAIMLLAFLSLATLGWFGWSLLVQDRAVEAQRVQERLQQESDRTAARLRESLAVIGEQLGEWVTTPPDAAALPDGSVLLVFSPGAVQVHPPGSLLYIPSLPGETDPIAGLFAEGESLEFTRGQASQSAIWYERLAVAGDPAVRAGALLRLGRVLRRSGRVEAACAAYRRLSDLAETRTAGVPAGLVGRHALSELCGSRGDLELLRRDLLSGRWRLTRGQFEFYWSEIARLGGREEAPPAGARSLAEAAMQAWQSWRREPAPRGEQTILAEGRAWVLVWRGSEGRQATLIAEPQRILERAAGATKLLHAIVDGEGHPIAGRRGDSVRAAVRTAAEARLPWTLYVSTPPEWDEGGSGERQRFVVGVLAVMTLFLVAGTYSIARAMRKESIVARLQTDFVSAVSHEFRSPLTSMRQMSELLALGRVPSEDRRQKYYDTLVAETRRLQRLVETLLNFGQMEGGGRQYRFEELNAGELVERVVGEFEGQLAGSGRRIEVHAGAETTIEADPEAISLALRNLVDNALKYSASPEPVSVEWASERASMAIRVQDKGMGIPADERRAVFEKFVRGRGAVEANVRGTGVGLAMVRHIVAAHGGEVQLETEVGKGSTFTMLLPKVQQR